MTSENWHDRNHFPPFLGLFKLSPIERVWNSISIFFLGVIITSFKNMEMYNAIINHQKQEPISAWYTVPFVLMSFWLLSPLFKSKRLNKIKEEIRITRKFPWKWFLLETLFDICTILIINLIYNILIVVFIMNIWN